MWTGSSGSSAGAGSSSPIGRRSISPRSGSTAPPSCAGIEVRRLRWRSPLPERSRASIKHPANHGMPRITGTCGFPSALNNVCVWPAVDREGRCDNFDGRCNWAFFLVLFDSLWLPRPPEWPSEAPANDPGTPERVGCAPSAGVEHPSGGCFSLAFQMDTRIQRRRDAPRQDVLCHGELGGPFRASPLGMSIAPSQRLRRGMRLRRGRHSQMRAETTSRRRDQ